MKAIKLLTAIFAVVALVSCSSEDTTVSGPIVGDWYRVSTKCFVDDTEILLTEDRRLFLYDEGGEVIDVIYYSDPELDMFSGAPLSFYNTGTWEYLFVKGTYKVKGDKVVCAVMGGEYEYTFDGEYLIGVDDEIDIASYTVSYYFNQEDEESGVADKFRRVSCFQKK